jgi:hypothetical protein
MGLARHDSQTAINAGMVDARKALIDQIGMALHKDLRRKGLLCLL